MLTGTDTTFAAALVWLLVLTLAVATTRRWTAPWMQAHPVAAIALLALAARLIPTLTLDRGLPYDIEAHWWVGSLTLAGRNVYIDPLANGRYPYPPLHQYLSALLVLLSHGDRALFLILDKLAPSLCGVALSVVIWALARRLDYTPQAALSCALLYAVNPLPAMVSAYHGQFEEIPMLLIAVALLLVLREPATSAVKHGRSSLPGLVVEDASKTRRYVVSIVLSALLLGLAIAYKTWPVLFIPPLVLAVRGWWRRLLYLPLTGVPLLASLWLYGLAFGRTGLNDAIARIHGYKGSSGFCWGYVSVLRKCWIQDGRLQPNAWVLGVNSKLLIAALLLVVLLLLWRRHVLEGCIAISLAFYLFSPGWGPNYSIWVLPFALLYSVRLAMTYTWLLLPMVSLTYLDSLYAAYQHNVFSWAVLKPLEAGLGLLTWIGIAVLLLSLYAMSVLPARSLLRSSDTLRSRERLGESREPAGEAV